MIKIFDKLLSKPKALLIIALSGLISIFLATAWVKFGAMELGALIYLSVPIIVAVVTMIIFSIVDLFFSKFRFQLTIAFAIINLAIGIVMRLDFYYGIFGW